MSVLTDNLTLRGRTGVCVNYHWTLADWEWEWLAASFGWIRIDGAWASVEASEGAYDWSNLDAWLDKCDQYGLGAVVILAYANPNVPSYGFSAWNEGPATDAQRAAYIAWAKALAQHVAGRNVVLEVWNEPHGDGYWYPTPNAADYARLARETVAAVKAVCPNQTVLAGGGLAYPDYETWAVQYPLRPSIRPAVAGDVETAPWYLDYITDVAQRGGFAGADAASFHFYQNEWPPEIVARQLETLRTRVSAPIADTESGYANEGIAAGAAGYYRPGSKTHNVRTGEDTAALWLVRKTLLQAALDVRLTCLFSWRNIGTDVYTESRPWLYKPQGGRDANFNAYYGQALVGSYGLCEHDPDDPGDASINYVDTFIPEYIVDGIDVVSGGSCYCEPTVTPLAGAPGGTGVVGFSHVGSAYTGSSKLYGGVGGYVKVGVTGNGTTGEINDVVLEGAGTDYTYGFNLTVTDPDPARPTGTVNTQSARSFDDAASCLLPGSVTNRGGATAAYLSFSGSLPYTTQATATLVSMNVAGVYYASESVSATVGQCIAFNGTPCANGVPGFGFVEYTSGGKLTSSAGPFGSITILCGKGYAVGDTLTNAFSLNGSGSGLEVHIAALYHAGLGIPGSNASYFAIDAAGSGYQVGEVVTFSTTSGSGVGVALAVTSVDSSGGVTGVYGIRGGTYAPGSLPTRIKIGNDFTTMTWLTDTGLEGGTPTVKPYLSPNNIKVNSGGSGYTVEPGLYITPDPSDTGPSSDTPPFGARGRCVLTNGVVTFINPNNSSSNNGAYYTKSPSVSIVAGHPSILTRVRTYGGEVTDVFVDGPGVGLSPTQEIAATVKGGKWPCLVQYTQATDSWAIISGYAGQKYTSGALYTAYDLGTEMPVDGNGYLDPSLWDRISTTYATCTFHPTCDADGVVTSLGAASGTPPDDGHICVLGPLGEDAVVSVRLRPKPNPRQPNRKATALADLMAWLGDYTFSENLSTDDKAYRLVFKKAGANDIHVYWRTTETLPEGTVTVNGSGGVAFVTVTNPGKALTEAPDVEFLSATGSGARAHCLMFDGGLVSAVVIDEAGSGYQAGDTVRFTLPTPQPVDTPTGAVRAWTWTGAPVALSDRVTLTDEPLFIEVATE